MPIDEAFLAAVRPLYSSELGTELVSPLIYSLIRMAKPYRALEIGAGYSTPFILLALKENLDDDEREIGALRALPPAEALVRLGTSTPPSYHSSARRRPKLLSIDNLSREDGVAARVVSVAAGLNLAPYLDFREADFVGYSKRLPEPERVFDFVWFDCGSRDDYVRFLEEYWPLVDPDGGLLLLHSTLTNSAIGGLLAELKRRQAAEKFELLSLLEPHKRLQNSVTLVRMLSGHREPVYSAEP